MGILGFLGAFRGSRRHCGSNGRIGEGIPLYTASGVLPPTKIGCRHAFSVSGNAPRGAFLLILELFAFRCPI
jgi:hypothetical protein